MQKKNEPCLSVALINQSLAIVMKLFALWIIILTSNKNNKLFRLEITSTDLRQKLNVFIFMKLTDCLSEF